MSPGFWSVSLRMLAVILVLAPLGLLIFRPVKREEGWFPTLCRILRDYWMHFAIFGGLHLLKTFVDRLNDPVRATTGHLTGLIHRIEGDLAFHIQDTFRHPVLTDLLNIDYLLGFMFISYFSLVLAAYADDRALANQTILVIVVLYLLAIPSYLFFNVEITSHYIPGMESLLYHSSADYLAFFAAGDPLDNAWPSLHIGIPWAFVLLFWWRIRDTAEPTWRTGYRRYVAFLVFQTLIFAFSILYLGVHWVLDIGGGLLIGYLGALITVEIHKEVFGPLYALHSRLGVGDTCGSSGQPGRT